MAPDSQNTTTDARPEERHDERHEPLSDRPTPTQLRESAADELRQAADAVEAGEYEHAKECAQSARWLVDDAQEAEEAR
jgi:hypothetical protein